MGILPLVAAGASTINAFFYDGFAVAVMGAEINALGHTAGADLMADTYRARGIQPARSGVLAAPAGRFDETVAAFEIAAGMPSPKPGGVWSKRSPCWPGEPVRRYGPDAPAGEHAIRVQFGGDSMAPLQVRLTMPPPERCEVP